MKKIYILPSHRDTASRNMAVDRTGLEYLKTCKHTLFRYYDWTDTATTFGYTQKWQALKQQVPEPSSAIRRPTAGGIVHHENSYTYMIASSNESELCKIRANESYKIVHEWIQQALSYQKIPSEMVPCPRKCEVENTHATESEPKAEKSLPSMECFLEAQTYDLIHKETHAKIAGAAQKRTRAGILIQGSLHLSNLNTDFNHQRFTHDFLSQYCRTYQLQEEPISWPDELEDEIEKWDKTFSSEDWQQKR